MANWAEFANLLQLVPGDRLNEDMMRLDFQVDGPSGQPQSVYLIREVVPPDLEIVKASCAVAPAEGVDISSLFLKFGDLNIGSLQLVTSDPPFIALGLTMVSSATDMSDPVRVALVLNILARASRRVAHEIGGFL